MSTLDVQNVMTIPFVLHKLDLTKEGQIQKRTLMEQRKLQVDIAAILDTRLLGCGSVQEK